jgi:hypothetical protein
MIEGEIEKLSGMGVEVRLGGEWPNPSEARERAITPRKQSTVPLTGDLNTFDWSLISALSWVYIQTAIPFRLS